MSFYTASGNSGGTVLKMFNSLVLSLKNLYSSLHMILDMTFAVNYKVIDSVFNDIPCIIDKVNLSHSQITNYSFILILNYIQTGTMMQHITFAFGLSLSSNLPSSLSFRRKSDSVIQ